jgi:CMP-N,N'-diacetyllegionaminic acid synthase
MKLFNDFIFVIPARKGSKSIKNKNVIKINNKKLIEYTFQSLRKVPRERKYLISDSEIIKKIAYSYKINTKYFRTAELSKDKTKLIENLCHFEKYISDKIKFKHYVVLQPTSPLRRYKDIENSLKLFLKNKSESLFSISQSLEHPNESIFFKGNRVAYFNKNKMSLRQNYKKSYFVNGAIYIFNRRLLKDKKIISNNNHSTYEMSKFRSIDLNDYQDLKITRKLLK